MDFFQYGNEEIEYLSKKDKKLGVAIERIGKIQRRVIPDLFEALVNSVIAQQISAKAAETIWNRFQERFGKITPEVLAKAELDAIQQCGLSMRKASYIKNVAMEVWNGAMNLEELITLCDEEVIKKLSSLKGIGVWTAEMLMIFSMQRPDIVSFGDLGIIRGMMKLYGKESISKEDFQKYRKRYSPCGTVASLYLWAISVED